MRARLVRRLCLSLCLAAFAACCLACGGQTESTQPVVVKDSIEDVLAHFHKDQAAASRFFKGKQLTVVATVDSAEWSDRTSKGPHLTLKTGTATGDVVVCFFTKPAAAVLSLKKGDRAKVTGTILSGTKIAGESVTLILDDCTLHAGE